MTTQLLNIPLASSVPASPDDGKVREFAVCVRLDAALEAFWVANGRPVGSRPVSKPVGPGASHKVKFVAGDRQPKTPRPYAYEAKVRSR